MNEMAYIILNFIEKQRYFSAVFFCLLSVSVVSTVRAIEVFDDWQSSSEQDKFSLLGELLNSQSRACQESDVLNLLEASKDTSYRVRNTTVLILAKCNGTPMSERIAVRLIDMIESPDERSSVRDTAISAIAGMGQLTPKIKAILLDKAVHSNGAIRREDATLALASFGVVDSDILLSIKKLLNSDRKSSHNVALMSYRALSEEIKNEPELADQILKDLYPRLPSGRVDFDNHAVYLIAELNVHPNDAVHKMIDMLYNSPFSRKAIAEVLPQFGEAAKDAIPALEKLIPDTEGFEKKTLEKVLADLKKL